MNLNTDTELTVAPEIARRQKHNAKQARNFFDRNSYSRLGALCQYCQRAIMVKEEEIITDAGGRGYLDMVGLEDEDFLRSLSPSSYLSSSVVSTLTTGGTPAAASSPTCFSHLETAAPPPYHHMLSFTGQEQYHYGGSNGPFSLQYNGGIDHVIPPVVPQKSSPTTECSSSISSPTSPTATSISSTKTQAFKKKGSKCSDQRKVAPAVAAAKKKPRVREKLGERIIALQQLVSPFGKSDTATVLHEALGYIRFLHDQVEVLSSPYMQRLPASAHAPESAAGTVVEPRRPKDLRSRGLCLVPISCTDHVAGDGQGNGADIWSVAVPAGVTNVTAAAGSKGAGALLPGHHPAHLA